MSRIIKELGPGELFVKQNNVNYEKVGDVIGGEISIITQKFRGGFCKYAIHNFRRKNSDSRI